MDFLSTFGAADMIFLLILIDLMTFRYKKKITIRHIFYFSFLWGLISIPFSVYTTNTKIDNNAITAMIGGGISMVVAFFILNMIIFWIVRYIYRHSQRVRNMFVEIKEIEKQKAEPKHKERK